MKISSPNFEHNEYIPARFTCNGEDINPHLLIEEVPSEAKSLVLVVDDPDAPSGTWVHWLVWNIDPKTTEIKPGEVPEGAVEGITSFEKAGYGGPCPPDKTHRYFFKLYALDCDLDLLETDHKAELEEAMESHTIDSAELIGLYTQEK